MTIAIIGAGPGGISVALALQERGIMDFVVSEIYERNPAVGGTWYKNAYPGCRCDIAAVHYSHSRYPNLEWTETHPTQDAIRRYWHDLAQQTGILDHCKFRHEFVKGEWNSEASCWDLAIRELDNQANGDMATIVKSEFLVVASGGLSTPKMPEIEGLDKFKGQMVHTFHWPQDLTPDKLRGKTVMIVGNGCSGTQLTVALAREPEVNVIAVGRTKQWYIPAGDVQGPYSTMYSELHRKINRVEALQWLQRVWVFALTEITWLVFRLGTISSVVRGIVKYACRKHTRDVGPGSIVDKVTPPFAFGALRPVFDGGYMRALTQPNVTVVWDKVVSMTSDEVTVSSGDIYKPDMVALATGFSGGIRLDIIGRTEDQTTQSGAEPPTFYHGTTVPGRPNCFYIMAANVAPSHASAIFQIATQANYISECVSKMREHGVKVLEVKKEAAVAYNKWIDKRAQRTVWVTAPSYIAHNGQAKLSVYFPGPVSLFWWKTRKVKWEDYIGGEVIAKAERGLVSWIATATVLVIVASVIFSCHK